MDTGKAVKDLSHDQQQYAMLGIQSFFSIKVAELQSKVPLKNDLLRQLGCLNHLKKNNKSTQSSIEKLSSLLQPKLNISEIVDGWKLFQVDNGNDIPAHNREEQIEKFWSNVFQLQLQSGGVRYKLLPMVIKSALILGQTNAESEHSLSVNTRVVTQGRTLLNEETIVWP